MKKMRKLLFVGLVLFILSALWVSPAIADTTTFEFTTYRLMYGNGVDDDYDGVIDNPEELDVMNGTEVVNLSMHTTDSWIHSFPDFANYSFPVDRGVVIDAHSENLWTIESSNNGSVSPLYPCYATQYFMPPIGPPVSYIVVNDTLPTVSFFINLSAKDIMNGCQEFWYRSPIAWDDTNYLATGDYPYYYLNIYRASDNQLVYASPYGATKGTPPYRLMSDNSTNLSGFKRVYFRVNFPMVTETKYRFEEFVKTVAGVPTNEINIWVSPSQDIGDDGMMNMYVFKDTPYARSVPIECSFSMICTWGMGRAGMENVIFGNDAKNIDQEIITNEIEGSTVATVESIMIVMPIRTTVPVDLYITVYASNPTYTNDEHKHIHVYGATGTVVAYVNMTDPGAGKNFYWMDVRIDNGIELDEDALAYVMYPSDGATHCVLNQRELTGYVEFYNNFAVDFEIREMTDPLPGGTVEDQSIDGFEFIVGLIGLLLGLLLTMTFILAPVGLALTLGGIAIGAVSAIAGGSMIIHSLTGGTLSDWPAWFSSGLIRVARAVWDGIVSVVGGLIDVIVNVVKAIIHLGELILDYGATVLSAIIEIIYFIIFLIVMVGWTLFLSVMRFILHGDFEGAWRLFKKGFISPTIKTAKKAESFYKKEAGYFRKQGRQRESFRSNQRRQNERTGSFVGANRARQEYWRGRSRQIEAESAGEEPLSSMSGGRME